MRRAFSYENVIPETQELYESALMKYARRYLEWRAKNPRRQAQDIGMTYPVWWRLRGPTAFATTADMIRYKTELLKVVASLAAATPESAT
jgi:hypothetical protein